MTEPAETSSLSARVAKGAGWIVAARFAVRLLGFFNTIVVARLLAPEDFGLVAVGVTTMQLLQGFSDIGVSQAVIRFRDATRADLDTLFTLSAIRGVLVAGLLAAAAPFAATFYGDGRVFWVFAGVALFPLLTAFVNPRFFEFERDLDFSREFIVTTLNKLAGVAVSVTIAVVYRSYAAIIFGLIAGGAVQLVLSYAFRPHLPRFSLASFDKVFGFSGWLAGVSFAAALNNKIDALVVARLAGAEDAGKYYVGVQIAELPSYEVAGPIARAIYPGFSSMDADPARMRVAYLRGVEALAVIALPAAFGFSFLAEDLVSLLIGEKWAGAGAVIAFLAPVMGLQTLFTATQFYAMARDLTKYVFYREAFFFLIRTPVFVWATLEYGLTGAVYACAAFGVVHAALNMALYARISGGGAFEPLHAARRSIAASCAMALFFIWIRPNFSAVDALPTAARIAVDAGTGAAVYFAALYGLWRAAGAPDGVERAAAAAAAKTRLAMRRDSME